MTWTKLTVTGLVLDVRSPLEWSSGRIPNAKHIYLPDLPNPHFSP